MATKNIGGSITLEGASKYNSDLKAIKSNLTELRSEMKLANAENKETANTYTALAQKEDILNRQIEQTSKKLEIYNKMYDDSAKKQKKAEESITTYSSKLQDAQKELDRMKASGTATDEELKTQEKVVADLSKELEKAQNGYNSASLKMNQYSSAANNTNADLVSLNNQLAENEKYLEEAKNSTDGTASSIDKFGKVADKAGEELQKTADAVQLLASSEAFKAISEGAKKVTETLLDCVEASTKWGTSMAKVQSIAQVSDRELSGMGKSIQDLAQTYGVGANEIAEATYQAISASVDAADATKFVEDSMKLAKGGFTDVTSAVDVMTTITNAYGKEANTTAHIMDTLIQTQNLGKTTVAELAESMGMVIPTASAYNVNLDNIASAYIQLTKNGINTANATTMINGLLTELADSGSAVSKVLTEKTGQSFGQLMKSGKSLGEIIDILGQSVDGDSEKFANLWGNVRAGRGAVTIFNAGADAFIESMDAIANSTGAADKAFETMADTAEMTDQRLQAATENLKVAIGEALEPTLNELKQSGIEALEPLTKFVEENPVLIQTLAGTVVAVAGVATAVTACAAAVTILRAAFGDLTGVVAVLGTAAVLGGVAGYSAAIGDAGNETRKLVNDTQKLKKELEESAKARQTNRDSMAQDAANAKVLSSELVRLQEKTELTVSEQQRQKEIVAELNALVPDLSLKIDEHTGKLDENSRAALNNVDALMEQYKAQAAQADLEEIAKGLYEADKNRIAVSQQLAEEVQKLKDLEAEYREELKANDEQANITFNQMDFQKGKIEELEQALISADEEYAKQQGYFEETTALLEENTSALGENAEAQAEGAEAAAAMSAAEEEAARKIEEANNKLRDSVASTVTNINPLFDQLSSKSKESLDSLAKNLEGNAKKAEEFATALNSATGSAQYGTDESFTQIVNTLAEKGPEATGLLEQLVAGAEGNTEQFNNLMKSMKTYLTGEDSVTAAVSTLTTELTAGMDATTKVSAEKESELTTIFTEEGAKQEEAVQTTADNIEKIATDGVTSAAKAVSDNASSVTTAAQTVATDAVTVTQTTLGITGNTSSKFLEMGVTTMKSFAEGVLSEESTVRAAFETVLNEAIGNLDLSGLTEKLNRSLGAALTG